MYRVWITACSATLAFGLTVDRAWPQPPMDTAFTYQGQLKQNGVPFTGRAELYFSLYGAEDGGTPLAQDVVHCREIVNGLFTAEIDFGAGAFTGEPRWVEIVLLQCDIGVPVPEPVVLGPRQPITPTPYALHTRGIVVDDVGSVGLGTDSPEAKLHVWGDIRSDHGFRVVDVGDASPNGSGIAIRRLELQLPPDPPEPRNADVCYDGTHLKLLTGTTSGAPSETNGLVIDNSGRVGIGTTAPGARLTVAGRIESTSGGFRFPDGTVQTTGSLWQTNGSDIYYNDGNIGIGYDNPNTKLYLLEDTPGIAFPLKLDNPQTNYGADGVGVLFSTGGSGGGPIAPDRGKGALAYVYTDTWNRGSFHFLQNDYQNSTNPFLSDSVMTIRNDGNVGIGTTEPGVPLQVEGGSDAATGGGGFLQVGASSGQNLAFDNDEIMARNGGLTSTLYLNRDGGSVSVGADAPEAKLHVSTTNATAVKGIGADTGGYFGVQDGSGYAELGSSNAGLKASGNTYGAFFSCLTTAGCYARVADGDVGIDARGTGRGGYFQNTRATPSESWARIAHHDEEFNRYYGIHAYGRDIGGMFEDEELYTILASGPSSTSGNGEKNFIQNHPHEKNKVIVYSSLEGDEVATFSRGRARLTNGEARVRLGETFKWVTNPDIGLTAHLTPQGDCNGLYVKSITTDELLVRELGDGRSNAVFSYVVFGLRIGFEESTRVRERVIESPIPAAAMSREHYETHPESRRLNALERFKRMRADTGDTRAFDLGASQALYDAIQESSSAANGRDRVFHPDGEASSRGPDDGGSRKGAPVPTSGAGLNVSRVVPADREMSRQGVDVTAANRDVEIEALQARLAALETLVAVLSNTEDGGE